VMSVNPCKSSIIDQSFHPQDPYPNYPRNSKT
jgi:hypothetical protein